MRVIFIGDPVELAQDASLSRTSTVIFGKKFPMSAEVDISDLPDAQKRKLANNSHFRVVGVDAPAAAPLVIPVSARAVEVSADLEVGQGGGEEVASAAPRRQRRAS